MAGAFAGQKVGAYAIPALIYAGQAWDEQGGELEDRNIGIAITSGAIQGALDATGYGLLVGGSKSKLLNGAVAAVTKAKGKANFNDVVSYVAKKDVSLKR